MNLADKQGPPLTCIHDTMVVVVVCRSADGIEWIAGVKEVDLAPLGVIVGLAVLAEPNEV